MEPENNKWYDIPGKERHKIGYFNGKWEIKSVSRLIWNGKVYFKSKDKILKQCKKNYYYNNLGLIHRIVAQIFIPNPENKRCINHIDGNKLNNWYNKDGKFNLEWCTYTDNNLHAYKIGLRKGRICPNKGKFGKDMYLSRKIGQYDLNGNLIKYRYGRRDVERGLGLKNIHNQCSGVNNHIKGGYIRRYC